MRLRWIGSTVLVLASLALMAGCGGSKSSGGDGGGDTKVNVKEGRKLFQQNCKTCHTLADANANGTFGPNLDDLPLDAERVKAQVKIGGGGMPADLVTGKNADVLAAYVASVAGGGGGDEG